MNDFFKRYILKSVLLIVGFFIANLFLFILFFSLYTFSVYVTDDRDNLRMDEIVEGISKDEEEKAELKSKMAASDSFFFVLDKQGKIIESENLPQGLNHSYSIAQIVSFTRWYLEDYPVTTRILDNGDILVFGRPKGSYYKYNFVFSPAGFWWEVLIFPFFLLGNLLIFLLISIFSTKKLQKEITPLANGLEMLARGESVNLEIKGELADLKEQINKTSELLIVKETSRREWIDEISHDIRTPLTVISNSAEILEKRDDAFSGELILSNVKKIENLIEQLNLENRFSAGSIPLKCETVNIYLFLSECLTDFLNENEIDLYPLAFNTDDDFLTTEVRIDREILKRAINNILNNTVIHNKGKTNINIEGLRERDSLIIRISDDGIGIDQNLLDEILSSENNLKRGMGLKLVKKIITAHGGEVDFKSSPNEGFTTTIRLKL